MLNSLAELDEEVTKCRLCPRLVQWREHVAKEKRAAFRDQVYWGRPVPGFGPPDARIAIIGLAPAAHGGNRTGRMFTGDQSGDFLFAAMYRVGLTSQPTSTHVGDGMELYGVRMASPVRCAPPENKPTPTERDNCRPWLVRELALLRPTLRAIVVLGAFGWQALMPALSSSWHVPAPRPKFGHGVEIALQATDKGADLHLFGCYHVSPHNTFTGRLTSAMVEEVLTRAKNVAGLE